MKIPEYPIKKAEQASSKIEQESDVPIIDIIRHGETDYKQGRNAEPADSFDFESRKKKLLNTKTAGFALDSEHLDLTNQGIVTIKETARELVGIIDKKHEVVLIVSSHSWRAHSSALIVEKELRDQGITILNNEGGVKFSQALNEAASRWHKVYSKLDDTEEGRKIVNEAKDDVDVYREERLKMEALSFQRFLRHISNVYRWLKPETSVALKGKRLRIVCFSHAEITRDFIFETLDLDRKDWDIQRRSQILEIIPKSQLPAEGQTVTKVKLYETNKRAQRGQHGDVQVVRGFKPKAD